MKYNPEIKNLAWYRHMTVELRKVTREIRAFDFMKKFEDDVCEEFAYDLENYTMHWGPIIHHHQFMGLLHIIRNPE